MTTLKTSKGIWIAVKLPIDAKDISIEKEDMYYKSDVWNLGAIGHLKKLPPGGQWQILGWSDELTEEQMEGIIETVDYSEGLGIDNSIGFPLFDDGKDDDGTWSYLTDNIKLSFASLLTSHSITGRALILEKIK